MGTSRRSNHRQSAAGPVTDAVGHEAEPLPLFLTPDETAVLLRTTRRAIYMLVERDQLPGLIRLGRRLLFRSDTLLHFLYQKSAPSPKE